MTKSVQLETPLFFYRFFTSVWLCVEIPLFTNTEKFSCVIYPTILCDHFLLTEFESSSWEAFGTFNVYSTRKCYVSCRFCVLGFSAISRVLAAVIISVFFFFLCLCKRTFFKSWVKFIPLVCFSLIGYIFKPSFDYKYLYVYPWIEKSYSLI